MGLMAHICFFKKLQTISQTESSIFFNPHQRDSASLQLHFEISNPRNTCKFADSHSHTARKFLLWLKSVLLRKKSKKT